MSAWCDDVQILLVTEEGAVLEGTQTNFFAVQDNKLYTAQEGVLMGTVRGVVLQVGDCRLRCSFAGCQRLRMHSAMLLPEVQVIQLS